MDEISLDELLEHVTVNANVETVLGSILRRSIWGAVLNKVHKKYRPKKEVEKGEKRICLTWILK
jgi:hypothetical protein